MLLQDASEAAGAAPGCTRSVRRTFQALLHLGKHHAGRALISRALRLCAPLQHHGQVEAVAYWLQGAFDAFAMGNYPYPSSYMGGDAQHPLPAWPMRAACRLFPPQPSQAAGGQEADEEEEEALLRAMAAAVGLLYNATADQRCFDVSLAGPAAGSQGAWDWQWCTELMAQELPYFPANGRTDMFWCVSEKAQPAASVSALPPASAAASGQ